MKYENNKPSNPNQWANEVSRKFSMEETDGRSYLTLIQPPAIAIPRKPATNADEDVEKEGHSDTDAADEDMEKKGH